MYNNLMKALASVCILILFSATGYVIGFQHGELQGKKPIYIRVNNHSVQKAMDVSRVDKDKQEEIMSYLRGE